MPLLETDMYITDCPDEEYVPDYPRMNPYIRSDIYIVDYNKMYPLSCVDEEHSIFI